jgi:hypothetical protein
MYIDSYTQTYTFAVGKGITPNYPAFLHVQPDAPKAFIPHITF